MWSTCTEYQQENALQMPQNGSNYSMWIGQLFFLAHRHFTTWGDEKKNVLLYCVHNMDLLAWHRQDHPYQYESVFRRSSYSSCIHPTANPATSHTAYRQGFYIYQDCRAMVSRDMDNHTRPVQLLEGIK